MGLIFVGALVFGAVIGSFLNVVIFRSNTGKGIGGRSACMSCSATLKWYELLPIVSYIVQKGKCRSCDAKISLQYPLVELLTALVSLALINMFLTSLASYMAYLLVFSLLIIITVYDLRHTIIPDWASYSLLIVVLAINLSGLSPRVIAGLGSYFLSSDFWIGPIIFSFFALLWLVSRGRWMGFGDAKLALGLALMVGYKLALSGLVLSFWIGAIVGIVLLLLRRGSITMKTEIPFAPFLVVSFSWMFFFPFSFIIL